MKYQHGEIQKNEDSVKEDESRPRPQPDLEISEKEAAQRLDEIHQYLRDRAARRHVIAQTETKSGQRLDWIPIESQTADRRIASPPPEERIDLGDQNKPADGRELRPPTWEMATGLMRVGNTAHT